MFRLQLNLVKYLNTYYNILTIIILPVFVNNIRLLLLLRSGIY